MAETVRPRRRPAGDESVEHRRHRMRVAQRKHRARKEQSIADLTAQLEASQDHLASVKEAVARLDFAFKQRSRHSSSIDELQPAIEALRSVVDSGATKLSDSQAYPQQADHRSGFVFGGPRDSLDSCPGPFASLLYEYSITLAHRLLANKDATSRRLGRKLFHHWILQMNWNGSQDPLIHIHDRLGYRLTQIALSRDSAQEKSRMWRTLKKPRLPGLSHYLDVAQVETFLQRQGFEFSEDLSIAQLDLSNIGDDMLPRLYSSSEDSSDSSGSYENLMTDEWQDETSFVNVDDPLVNEMFWTLTQDDQKTPDPPPNLPFGLLEHPKPDAPDPQSTQAPHLVFDEGTLCSADPAWREQADPTLDFQPFYHQLERRQDSVKVNVNELVMKLASKSICIGEAGPGFCPTDVNEIVASLIRDGG